MKFQQGDVVFKRVEDFNPDGMKKLKTLCIQEGEVTGHSHVLEGGNVKIFEDHTKNKFVQILSEAVLRHEEHRPFKLPPGKYKVHIVREVDHINNIIRQVAD